MPKPEGNPNKMTQEERDRYYSYFASVKKYGAGKATIALWVDDPGENEAVERLLFQHTDVFATFQRDRFRDALVAELGFSKEKADSYTAQVFFDDDTYGVPSDY